MKLADFADNLGFAELDVINTDAYFFHGCLADRVGAILSEGLRVNCEEPCLTVNPASALLKYANPGLNSNNIYSGKVWYQVDQLLAGNAIAYSASRQACLERAIDYWRSDPQSGAAFVFDLAPYRVKRVGASELLLKKQSVEGGISKWLYAHLSVEPKSGPGDVTWVKPQSIAGYMLPSKLWAHLFEQYHPVRQERIPAVDDGAIYAGRLLKLKECFIPVEQTRGVEAMAFSITRRLAVGFLCQELRRAFLGIMAAKGKRIIKNDFLPESEWLTGSRGYTNKLVAQLEKTVYSDGDLNEMKVYWLNELCKFWSEANDEAPA